MNKTIFLVRLLTPVAIIIICYQIFTYSLFSKIENSLQDAVTRAVAYTLPFDKDIIILEIDNNSIVQIGQWPWPRKVWSEVFTKLNQANPKVVGLDILFSEKSNLGEKDDDFLKVSLSDYSSDLVFPVETINYSKTLKPLDIFLINKNITLGYVDISIDSKDSVVRSVPADKYIFAKAIFDKIEKNENKNQETLTQDNSSENIIVSEYKTKNINYARGAGLIHRVSVIDFMSKNYDIANLKNKIVLIGATASNLHDEARTPMTTSRLMSGVEIHANILNQYINNLHIYKLDTNKNLLLIFVLLILMIVISYIKNISLRGITVLIALIAFIFTIAELRLSGYIVPILWPAISIILSAVIFILFEYNQDKKSKKQIIKLFGKYVSKNVLSKLLENPEGVVLGGEKKLVTVLFSDIRGFTTLSEKLEPEKVVNFLNEYFEAMSQCVIDRNGVLDKYIGDAIMAFWGAPIDDINHADNAVMAAKDMILKLKPLQEKYKLIGIDLDIGIGLHTGYAVVGNIGSSHRFDYTVIGDTVNTSSRLEGLNKEYKTNIIASEEVKNLIKNKEITWSSLGEVKVKGREKGINLFSIS